MTRPQARADFESRLGRRSDQQAEATEGAGLAPPGHVRAEAGVGHVTLRWEPVDGAIGYLVQRAGDGDGTLVPVDHGGRDVLAVPGPHYADTTGAAGTTYRYAVSALTDLERGPGHPSEPVRAQALPAGGAPPTIAVVVHADQPAGRLRRLWHMIGSERLLQLLIDERTAGRDIASEFTEALRLAHTELGVEHVRAHAILHDDMAVYRERGGDAIHDFTRVGAVYDKVRELALRPVVELSFMPRDLAADPHATVFAYDAIISPPGDWRRWEQLVEGLARYLVERYGVDEVARWGFEVWNEPNLEVFWSGSQADYVRLYAAAARAVKAVDARLPVGGPATAAAGWLGDFLDAVVAGSLPLDFVSTHTYGNVPLNVRAATDARDLRAAVWWTEWGVTPTHFAAVADSAFGAPFVLHGMKAAQTTADAVAYWVISDHFEELGRPDRLWHGGFGLLSVGNLRKPRWWALALAEQLDDELCAVRLSGDGAGALVDAWASTAADGRVDLLVWNGTLQQDADHADGRLDRWLDVRVEGLRAARYQVAMARVDSAHSNISAAVEVPRWPSADQWAQLRAADRLAEEDLGVVTPTDRTVHLSFALPLPGVARVRLAPNG